MKAAEKLSSNSDSAAENGSHDLTKSDLLSVQDFKLQNSHLKSLNDQLTTSYNSSQAQLKAALETASCIQPLQSQITQLRSQLSEANTTMARQKQEILALHGKSSDISQRLSQETELRSKESSSFVQQQQQLSNVLQSTKLELEKVKSECAAAKAQTDELFNENQVLHKSKSKLKNQISALSNTVSQLKDQITASNLERDKLSAENKAAQQEIDLLQVHVSASQATFHESETAWSELQNNSILVTKSVEALQHQFEQQKQEIEKISSEKKNFLCLIQKLYSSLCVSESLLEKASEEKSSLASRLKQRGAEALTDTELSQALKDLSLPFRGSLAEKCKKVVNDDNILNNQKIQTILNETAREIDNITAENGRLSLDLNSLRKEAEKLDNKNKGVSNLLKVLVQDWKLMEYFEKTLSTSAFAQFDPNFLSLMAERIPKFSEIDGLSDIQQQIILSADFFRDDSISNRVSVLSQTLDLNKEGCAIVLALFLENSRLAKQMISLNSSLAKKKELQSLMECMGCTSYSEIPDRLSKILEKMKKMKKSRKEIHQSIKAAQSVPTESSIGPDPEIESLHEENSALKAKLQILQNESLLNQKSQTPQPERQPDPSLVEKISQLESSLACSKRENENLKSQITALKMLPREEPKNEDNVRVVEIQEAYKQLQARMVQAHDKSKRKLKKQSKAYEERIAKLEDEYNHSKESFSRSIDSLKARLLEVQSISKKLSASLSESEKRNMDLITENQRMSSSKLASDQNAATLKSSISRERQTQLAEKTAAILEVETRLQKERSELRSSLQTEKQGIIDQISSQFGPMYGMGEFDFDQESVKQLISRAASDMKKLRLFQESVLKSTSV